MTRRFFAGLALALLTACAAPEPARDAELYEALGERPGIRAIVDETLKNVADDARIVDIFADSDIGRLRTKLVEQFCAISGGPCEYTGDSMKKSHAGLGIDAAEFNAFVEDLRTAMIDLQVPESAQNRLLARLAPLREDILEKEERTD
ncbi:MAG: group 1 truncated hemoglobin [Halofilum sp. (in: g-proteobacteria)]|nr:group 1 truncated hemoglobin [Halofilum sp. (in: g-proteobacteria)]